MVIAVRGEQEKHRGCGSRPLVKPLHSILLVVKIRNVGRE
jgi:hypothetical protein